MTRAMRFVVLYMALALGANAAAAQALSDLVPADMRGLVIHDAPQPVTDAPFLDMQDAEGRLSDYRGRVVVLNFWATWCAPCVVEMPYLDALEGRYGSDDFEVVTISMDRRIEEPLAFFEERALENLNFYFDPGMSIAFGVMGSANRGLPLTILYDRNGFEIGRLAGEAEWDSPEAHALIEAALERY